MADAPARDRPRPDQRRSSTSSACTCTSARRSSSSTRSGARSRRSPPLGDFGTYNLGGGLGVAYTADQEPPRIADYVAAKVDTVHRVLGPGKRILDEPGRALVANSTVTLYTVQSVKRNVSTWVAVDGGMSDNLRPMLYGSVYEAQIADRFGGGTPSRLTGKHCESGDVIVRDVRARRPAGRRRHRHARDRRLRATRWPTTTTACRARR